MADISDLFISQLNIVLQLLGIYLLIEFFMFVLDIFHVSIIHLIKLGRPFNPIINLPFQLIIPGNSILFLMVLQRILKSAFRLLNNLIGLFIPDSCPVLRMLFFLVIFEGFGHSL